MDKMLKAHYSVVMNAVYEHDNGEIVGHVVSFEFWPRIEITAIETIDTE